MGPDLALSIAYCGRRHENEGYIRVYMYVQYEVGQLVCKESRFNYISSVNGSFKALCSLKPSSDHIMLFR